MKNSVIFPVQKLPTPTVLVKRDSNGIFISTEEKTPAALIRAVNMLPKALPLPPNVTPSKFDSHTLVA